jgi:hypothetical protein
MKETKVRVGPDRQWEKLYQLRELTRRTGILHELQVLQLKMWPLVFTNATDSECEFNYETKAVVFNLKKLKGKLPANLQERLEHLTKATQQLLGDEYVVVININSKKAFHGPATSDA